MSPRGTGEGVRHEKTDTTPCKRTMWGEDAVGRTVQEPADSRANSLPDARGHESRCAEGEPTCLKHGRYSAEAMAERRKFRSLLRELKEGIEIADQEPLIR